MKSINCVHITFAQLRFFGLKLFFLRIQETLAIRRGYVLEISANREIREYVHEQRQQDPCSSERRAPADTTSAVGGGGRGAMVRVCRQRACTGRDHGIEYSHCE